MPFDRAVEIPAPQLRPCRTHLSQACGDGGFGHVVVRRPPVPLESSSDSSSLQRPKSLIFDWKGSISRVTGAIAALDINFLGVLNGRT